MLQIGFISNKKSQHLAMFKSVFFHYPCRSISVPPIFGCFIQPLQSGLDGMRAATAWIFCVMTVLQLHGNCCGKQVFNTFCDPPCKFLWHCQIELKNVRGQKKTFQLELKSCSLSQDSGAEKKHFLPRKKNWEMRQKVTWFEKKHEKPGDLGDLAKSTYNNLVTFDSRGT